MSPAPPAEVNRGGMAAPMQADTLSGWFEAFSALHQRARRGELSPDDRPDYLRAREELVEAMLLAQEIGPHPGAGRRRSLRVAQALPVELQGPGGRVLAVTLDLSAGGFSTIVSESPELGVRVGFRLRLGRGYEPVTGSARIANAMPQNGSVRIGVAFEEMASADRERLELVLVDAVLKQFGHWNG
jgi:PilZ domain